MLTTQLHLVTPPDINDLLHQRGTSHCLQACLRHAPLRIVHHVEYRCVEACNRISSRPLQHLLCQPPRCGLTVVLPCLAGNRLKPTESPVAATTLLSAGMMRTPAAALVLAACLLVQLAPAFAGQCESRGCLLPIAC